MADEKSSTSRRNLIRGLLAMPLVGLIFRETAASSDLKHVLEIQLPIKSFSEFTSNAKMIGKSESLHELVGEFLKTGELQKFERVITNNFIQYKFHCSSASSKANVLKRFSEKGFLDYKKV